MPPWLRTETFDPPDHCSCLVLDGRAHDGRSAGLRESIAHELRKPSDVIDRNFGRIGIRLLLGVVLLAIAVRGGGPARQGALASGHPSYACPNTPVLCTILSCNKRGAQLHPLLFAKRTQSSTGPQCQRHLRAM